MNTIQSRTGGEVTASSVRMPRDLRDNLKIQAIRAGRSYNTHVVMILQEALAAGGPGAETKETAAIGAPRSR